MKKTCLIIMVMLFSAAAYGQASVGVRGGLNFSNINHGEELDDRFDNLDRPFQTGFNFGVGAEYYLHWRFFLYTELLFTQKGDSYKGTGTVMDPIVGEVDVMEETEISLNYLEWPILGRFKFGDVNQFYINAGPTLGYWLGGNIEYEFRRGDETESVDDRIKFKNRNEIIASDRGNVLANEDVNRFELGAAIGGGMMLGKIFKRMNIDVRYTIGLTSIHENGGFNREDTWKNNVLSISIGYFWLENWQSNERVIIR